jgi:hypothetical protein
VWPNLRETIPSEIASVVLVVAAGAVGKSAAAEALAARLRWPIIDSARAQVGSYSLSGLLHDALGFESTYISEVANGRAGIIVDALDEAHLRAGISNFQAFLENICKLGGYRSTRTAIIAFSRPDTAEIVKLYFEESRAPLTVVSIDFFTYDQTGKYLDTRLAQLSQTSSDPRYEVAIRHQSAYSKLRERRMTEIAEALLSRPVASIKSSWIDVSEFLGYAPVLSVLAELLAVSNPYRELSRSLTDRPSNAHQILLKIIDTLLLREQGKFKDQVLHRMLSSLPPEDEWNSSKLIYSPQEQSIRLVAKYLGLSLIVPPPASMPTALRPQYELDATQFVADHPFLAGSKAVNVVFSDYILAKATADPDCLLTIDPNGSKAERTVGPFYYQFVHHFAPASDASNASENKISTVAENLVSEILESHSKSLVDPNQGRFIYLQHDNESAFILRNSFLSQRKVQVEFDIRDASGVLTLLSHLSRGLIATDGAVVIGSPKQRFLLGPEMVIGCKELNIETDALSITKYSSHSGPACQIMADEIRVAGNLSVDCAHQDDFIIYGESGWPALRPFIKPPHSGRWISQASYVELRAIIRAFRQGSGQLPSVYGDLMDHRVVASSPLKRKFLDRLIENRIICKAAGHYYLDTAKLAKRGISWHSVIDGEPTDSVLQLLCELTEDSPS